MRAINSLLASVGISLCLAKSAASLAFPNVTVAVSDDQVNATAADPRLNYHINGAVSGTVTDEA